MNRIAVECAQNARTQSGIADLAVAGSISHWTEGHSARPNPDDQKLTDVFGEMAAILKTAGADLILLEMMYIPERIELALGAALESGLPVCRSGWVSRLAGAMQDSCCHSNQAKTFHFSGFPVWRIDWQWRQLA